MTRLFLFALVILSSVSSHATIQMVPGQFEASCRPGSPLINSDICHGSVYVPGTGTVMPYPGDFTRRAPMGNPFWNHYYYPYISMGSCFPMNYPIYQTSAQNPINKTSAQNPTDIFPAGSR
jgi:hypothetical protein